VSTPQLYVSALALWSLAVLSVLTGRMLFIGSGVSVTEYVGWAFLAGAPVFLVAIFLRDRPNESIARLLYDVERSNTSPLKRLTGDAGGRQ